MPANDDEHNHLKYSDLQVKQEFNLPSNLTQFKLDLEFPGTSLYDEIKVLFESNTIHILYFFCDSLLSFLICLILSIVH